MAQDEASLAEGQISFQDIWQVLWTYRWLIAGFVSIAVLGSSIYIAQSPGTYKSSAIITPLFGELSAPLLAELNSEAMRYDVIRTQDLVSQYSVGNEGEAEYMLKAHTHIGERGGKIQISVNGQDSTAVANIANSYVQVLQQRLRAKQIEEIGQAITLLTERLGAIKERVFKVEHIFAGLRERSPSHAIHQRDLAGIQVIAEIRAQLAIQRLSLPKFTELDSKAMEIVNVEDEQAISQPLKKQVKLLDENNTVPFSQEVRLSHDPKDYLANSLSLVVLSYVQVLSQLKFYEIYLGDRLSELDFQEKTETPLFHTLDMATPSSTIVRPRAELPIFVAVVIAFAIGAVLAFSLHYVKALRKFSHVRLARGPHVEAGS